jgi:hypothetical protein
MVYIKFFFYFYAESFSEQLFYNLDPHNKDGFNLSKDSSGYYKVLSINVSYNVLNRDKVISNLEEFVSRNILNAEKDLEFNYTFEYNCLLVINKFKGMLDMFD